MHGRQWLGKTLDSALIHVSITIQGRTRSGLNALTFAGTFIKAISPGINANCMFGRREEGEIRVHEWV